MKVLKWWWQYRAFYNSIVTRHLSIRVVFGPPDLTTGTGTTGALLTTTVLTTAFLTGCFSTGGTYNGLINTTGGTYNGLYKNISYENNIKISEFVCL